MSRSIFLTSNITEKPTMVERGGGDSRVVLTYGTFDLFHVGHVRLLQRLRALGTSLVVGLSTDEFNAGKGKQSVIPYEARKEVLQACRYVDKVIPENSWDQKASDIHRENASIFAMGDDWAGRFDELAAFCEVVYLPRTRDISTTDIKGWVSMLRAEQVSELLASADKLRGLIAALR